MFHSHFKSTGEQCKMANLLAYCSRSIKGNWIKRNHSDFCFSTPIRYSRFIPLIKQSLGDSTYASIDCFETKTTISMMTKLLAISKTLPTGFLLLVEQKNHIQHVVRNQNTWKSLNIYGNRPRKNNDCKVPRW